MKAPKSSLLVFRICNRIRQNRFTLIFGVLFFFLLRSDDNIFLAIIGRVHETLSSRIKGAEKCFCACMYLNCLPIEVLLVVIFDSMTCRVLCVEFHKRKSILEFCASTTAKSNCSQNDATSITHNRQPICILPDACDCLFLQHRLNPRFH